ncbi:MAG: hypothetical protein HUU23_04775, partial [Caldilineales bacterium]|nr:hypothetical protein [Caldilineales bacterium]
MSLHRLLISASLLLLSVLLSPLLAPAAAHAPAAAPGSWQRVWKSEGVIHAFVALDAATLVGVGSEGMILSTANAGETWRYHSPFPDRDLYTLVIRGARAWAAGAGGIILHSADGRATWTQQADALAPALRGLAFSNNSTGWAVGDGGAIWHT